MDFNRLFDASCRNDFLFFLKERPGGSLIGRMEQPYPGAGLFAFRDGYDEIHAPELNGPRFLNGL